MGILPRVALLVLYIIVCALHLFACARPNHGKLRAATKCCLMPLLALCYAVNAHPLSRLVLIAILCGFVGDVALLGDYNSRRFIGGICAFAAGHLCYAVHMLRWLAAAPAWWWIIPPIVLVYAAGIALGIRQFKRFLPHRLVVPCLVYMIVIGFMSFSALLVLINRGVPSGMLFAALPFIGSLSFIASDSTLTVKTFSERPLRYGAPAVMGTYILAQTLIVIGLLF